MNHDCTKTEDGVSGVTELKALGEILKKKYQSLVSKVLKVIFYGVNFKEKIVLS